MFVDSGLAGIGHNSGRFRFTAPIVEIDPRDALWESILSSDASFAAWVKESVGRWDRDVFVRASVYGGRKISGSQELGSMASLYDALPGRNGYMQHDEMRRPVAMKGALRVMIAEHSYTAPHIANGYCEEVAKRYLRRIKYTNSDRDSHNDFMISLERRLRKKHRVSHAFRIAYRNIDFYVGSLYESDTRAGKWEDGNHIEYDLPVKRKPAVEIRVPQPRRSVKISTPQIRTRKPDERAILRAVYEMGLIKEGDTL